MARKYELKKRADRQEQTRRRIIEAAIELHGMIGPARTTVSAIAERAGVQRHTYYRHFPDERALELACSGLHLERNPLPDPEPWRGIVDPRKRVRQGLAELYAFFERNESMLTNVMRDSEVHPLTREIAELQFGPPLGAIRETIAQALPRRARKNMAVLDLALDFGSWRLLVNRAGLSPRQAADLMTDLLFCR